LHIDPRPDTTAYTISTGYRVRRSWFGSGVTYGRYLWVVRRFGCFRTGSVSGVCSRVSHAFRDYAADRLRAGEHAWQSAVLQKYALRLHLLRAGSFYRGLLVLCLAFGAYFVDWAVCAAFFYCARHYGYTVAVPAFMLPLPRVSGCTLHDAVLHYLCLFHCCFWRCISPARFTLGRTFALIHRTVSLLSFPCLLNLGRHCLSGRDLSLTMVGERERRRPAARTGRRFRCGACVEWLADGRDRFVYLLNASSACCLPSL